MNYSLSVGKGSVLFAILQLAVLTAAVEIGEQRKALETVSIALAGGDRTSPASGSGSLLNVKVCHD